MSNIILTYTTNLYLAVISYTSSISILQRNITNYYNYSKKRGAVKLPKEGNIIIIKEE